MECPDETLLASFARGELGPEAISRLEDHLDSCGRCLRRVGEVAEIVAARATNQALPDDSRAHRDSTWVQVLAAFRGAFPATSDGFPPSASAKHGRFGPYVVEGILGRGGMGVVYRARHEESGLCVAIKTVDRPSVRSLGALRAEIDFLRRQNTPGVVRVFDDGNAEGKPWYAMELLQGTTLEDFNRSLWNGAHVPLRETAWAASSRGSPATGVDLPPAAGGRLSDVLALYAALCEPLAVIHSGGVIHCDLKPPNVFVQSDMQPVLMDFGLVVQARGAIGREVLEVAGHLRGTLPYMAPELVRGESPDARADLYSLGCILYESVTGHPPFVEGTAHAILEAHLHTNPIPLSKRVAGVPPELDELLASLLAKRADQRIGDAGRVKDWLARIHQAPKSNRPPTPSQPYLFRPRLVGRDDVIDQLDRIRIDAERGRGRLVVISGESGIGKTFVASEIAQRAARAGWEVVTGECQPLAPTGSASGEIASPALEPFRKLIQRAADLCHDEGPYGLLRVFGSERTVSVLTKYAPGLAYLLRDSESEQLAPLPPAAERERVLRALADVLDGIASEKPLLLVVDDLQWADDLSLAFLEMVASEFLSERRIVVLALCRSEETPEPILALHRNGQVSSIKLARLDPDALRILVNDLLSTSPPQDFVAFLSAHSEGNPFFVAEYLRAAAGEQVLERTLDGWRLAASGAPGTPRFANLAIPRSLSALLERRLSLLTSSAQRITEAAAVLGREFDTSMLTALTGMSTTDVEAAIRELIARQVVDAAPLGRHRFVHDKTREAAYARVDEERRRALHLGSGELLESTFISTPSFAGHYVAIAYHFRSGGRFSQAIDYFERAGEHALRSSADADAVRYFREARELGGALQKPVANSRRASWERGLGEALHGLGDLAGSKAHLVEAVGLLGVGLSDKPPALAARIAKQLGTQVLHRFASKRMIGSKADASDALLGLARAYELLQQIFYYRGEYLPLFLANLTTLNLAEKAAPSATLAAAYTNAGAASGIIPLPRLASMYFRLAGRALETAYDPEVDSYHRLLLGVYELGRGHWDTADDAVYRSLILSEKLGFARRWEEAAGAYSAIAARRSNDEGVKWSRRLLESAERRGDPQMMTWGFLGLGDASLRCGEGDEAERWLRRAELLGSSVGKPEQIWSLSTRATLALAAGDLAVAETAADRAAVLVSEAKPIHLHCAEAYARIAQVSLELWSRASGPRAIVRRTKMLGAYRALHSAARVFPVVSARYWLAEGYRWLLSGRRSGVAQIWQRGLGAARSLGLRYEEALLLLALSRTFPEDPESHSSAARGREILAALGLSPNVSSRGEITSRGAHSALYMS